MFVLFFLWHLFLWPFLLLNQGLLALNRDIFFPVLLLLDEFIKKKKKQRNNPLRLIFIMGTHRVKVYHRIILSSTTIHLCWCLLRSWSCLFVFCFYSWSEFCNNHNIWIELYSVQSAFTHSYLSFSNPRTRQHRHYCALLQMRKNGSEINI